MMYPGGQVNGRRSNFPGREGTGRRFRAACLVVLATAASASGAEVDFFSGRALPWTAAYQTTVIYAADVDGDGDMDLLAGETTEMGWFENTDGLGTFADVVTVGSALSYPSAVFTADMDGDGDLDYVTASSDWPNGMTYWFENIDGIGNCSDTEQYVYAEGEVNGVNWATAADLDGDGSLDILYAGSRSDETIGWCKNDGTGTFNEPRTIISTTFDGPNMVVAADLNGDDFPDVLVASYTDGRITWFENSGIGSFPAVGVDLISDIIGATYVSAADIDGDGDLDVIATFYGNAFAVGGSFMIFYNTDGAGTFSDGEVVGYMDGARSMVAADIDGDLDLDLLGCSELGSVVWYENTDGSGTFANETIVAVDVDPVEAIAVDIDGDGDLDIVTAVWTSGDVVWYENLRLTPVPSTPSPATSASPTASPSTNGGTDDIVPPVDETPAPTAAAGKSTAPAGSTPSPVIARTVDATDAPVSGSPAPISGTPAPSAIGSGEGQGATDAPVSGGGGSPTPVSGTPAPSASGSGEGQDGGTEGTNESSTDNAAVEVPVGVVTSLISGGMLLFLARK